MTLKTIIIIAAFISLLPMAIISGIATYTFVRWQFVKKCEDDNYSVDIISEMKYIGYAKGERPNG